MGAKILVIDDVESMREMLTLTLEFEGYEATQAENGAKALDAVRAAKGKFDLILCDIEMPEMDGLRFVQLYREEFGAKTPIIMLTAEENPYTLDRLLEAGASSVLLKPFEPMRMLEEIKDKLD